MREEGVMTRWQMRMMCISSAVGVLVGLSGCGDKEPMPSASETANVQVLSANPEPLRDRPVLEPPEPPVALDDPGHDGAVAAAEYFYRLSVYAAASGDTTELEAVSGEECASCSDYVARIKNFYDSGGYWTTMPEIEVYDSNDLQREESPNRHVVVLDFLIKSYRYVSGDGELHSVNADVKIMAFAVTYSDRWVLGAVEDLPDARSVDSIRLKEQ